MVGAEDLRTLADQNMGGGGLFVYDLGEMAATAQSLQAAKMPYGLTVRYAAKANPAPEIVQRFQNVGLSFDASSAPEAVHLLESGVKGHRISLSSQVLAEGAALPEALDQGVLPVATSLRQIDVLRKARQYFPLKNIALRVNPGEGSGGNKRTTVGGPAASFGIWKDQLPEALEIAEKASFRVNRIHTHIGSGVNPLVWRKTIQNSLEVVEQCPDVTTLDIGGGYKIARMSGEQATDMDEVFGAFGEELARFRERTSRKIHLEIEPGTLLVGNAAVLLARVEDIVSTGQDGYDFIKVNAGMNAMLRPSLYGAQHPIKVLTDNEARGGFVVVGPCCESGDILTPAPGNPEEIQTRELNIPDIGDYVAIGGVGAYCASMRAAGYNHIPEPTSIFVDSSIDQQG